MKEMERKHLCELLVLERLISEEKESDLRKATQQLNKEKQQERLFELKVCTISSNFFFFSCRAFQRLVGDRSRRW